MRIIAFILMSAMTVAAQGQIQKQLIDREATKPTRHLYRFLRNKVWGKQVLSGCQARWDYNTTDADGIYERSGRYPAVNIFDFQHFRQPRLNYMGPTAKDWHEAGGIVGFIWHWSVPVDSALTDTKGFAFYSPTGSPGRPGTLFSPRRALQDGTPEQRIINENLDTIARYLLHYTIRSRVSPSCGAPSTRQPETPTVAVRHGSGGATTELKPSDNSTSTPSATLWNAVCITLFIYGRPS